MSQALPRGRSHLADQLGRAALLVVDDIAEGAGKFSKPDKCRFYTAAIGSATESAAMLDVCLRRQLIALEARERRRQPLDRVVATLVEPRRALRDG